MAVSNDDDPPTQSFSQTHPLNAHEKPPDEIRNVYKNFQKLSGKGLYTHPQLVDATLDYAALHPALEVGEIARLPDGLQQIFEDFLAEIEPRGLDDCGHSLSHARVFRIKSIPGLSIYPSLLPPTVQLPLLDKLLHRDLSSQEHQTNLHLHYHVPYPVNNDSSTSFFDPSASSSTFEPKDASIHKPISIQQVLNKKLRWMTLGGQYDWTNKIYPYTQPPAFPQDLKSLLELFFPMKAEAAIVNFYSPGDTLSLHRDVSEQSSQPLVSISLGCDGIFVIGLKGSDENGESRIAALRLRSGDAVLMSGQSRYAWHGVPKILEGTCPEWMEDWPCDNADGTYASNQLQYEQWRGWMKGKRVNLNVRQMFDEDQSCRIMSGLQEGSEVSRDINTAPSSQG